MLLAAFSITGTTWLFIAGGVALLSIGKASPLQTLLTSLKDAAAKANAASEGSQPSAVDVRTTRLPPWLTDANDLQQMLLHLAHEAATHQNVPLKDATLALMPQYADLQVAVPSSDPSANE